MIRNVLLIYAALICVVSIFKGNPFPHQETVLFFDVKQPGWVTTDPWLLWICVVVDLIAGIFILIRDILRDFQKLTGFCHSNVMQKNIQKCWKSW